MNLTRKDLAVLMSAAGAQSGLQDTQLNREFLQIVGLYATASNAERIDLLTNFEPMAAEFLTETAAVIEKVSAEIALLKSQS